MDDLVDGTLGVDRRVDLAKENRRLTRLLKQARVMQERHCSSIESLRVEVQSLQQKSSRYAEILNRSAAVHYVFHIDGGRPVLNYVSDNVVEVLGCDAGPILADPLWWPSHLHEEDRGAMLQILGRLVESDPAGEVYEYRLRHADGSYRWIRDELRVHCHEDGRPWEAVGCWLDITPRRESDEKIARQLADMDRLRQSMLYMLEDLNESKEHIEQAKRRWTSTFDAISEPIFIHDADGKVVQANRAYASASGCPIQACIGRPFWDMFPRRPLPPGEDWPVNWPQELEFEHMNGRTYLSQSYTMPTVHDEEVPHRVHVMRDVTERKASADALSRTLKQTVRCVARAIEVRDSYTGGHQYRVAQLAAAIADKMGLAPEEIEGIYWGAIVHDIGKIYVPAEILNKPSALTELERRLVQEHASVGFDILQGIEFPWPVGDIIYQHHERLDGSGYPRGLSGDEICRAARVVAVADVLEAMSCHRPYRAGLGLKRACTELERGAGKQYDSLAVDACVSLIASGRVCLDQDCGSLQILPED